MLLYIYVNTIVVISTFFYTMVGLGLCFTYGKLQCVRVCATLPSLLSFTYIHTQYTQIHIRTNIIRHLFWQKLKPPSPPATSALFAVEFWEICPENAILLWRRTLLPPPTHQATLAAQKKQAIAPNTSPPSLYVLLLCFSHLETAQFHPLNLFQYYSVRCPHNSAPLLYPHPPPPC